MIGATKHACSEQQHLLPPLPSTKTCERVLLGGQIELRRHPGHEPMDHEDDWSQQGPGQHGESHRPGEGRSNRDGLIE